MSGDDTELERQLAAVRRQRGRLQDALTEVDRRFGTPGAEAGPGRRWHAAIEEGPLDQDPVTVRPEHGALVAFVGIVRDSDGGREVLLLEYEAHPDAEDALRDSVQRIAGQHPEVAVEARHAVGRLEIGDAALVVTAASPHRAEAFAACAALVDDIKATVPIWKRQHFADGASEWVSALE